MMKKKIIKGSALKPCPHCSNRIKTKLTIIAYEVTPKPETVYKIKKIVFAVTKA